MDELLSLIWAFIGTLFNWRLVLSIVASILLALVLSRLIAPFTASYCVNLVILGTAFGVYWQGHSEAGVSLTVPIQEPKIPRSFAFLLLAVIGFFGGAVEAELLHSEILGATSLIVGVAIVGLWHHFILCHSIALKSLAFSAISLVSGFSLFLILKTLHA